jgi:hypothetical protein
LGSLALRVSVSDILKPKHAYISKISLIVLVAVLSVAWVQHAAAAQSAACRPPFYPPSAWQGRIIAICGIHAPEDLEALPDGKFMIISETRGMDNKPGHLAIMNLATDSVSFLPRIRDGGPIWGDPACSDPGINALYSPHGIHLSRRPDGKLELLVINHAGREAVEFYEIRPAGGSYEALWRGCVVNHGPGLFNDLAANPRGGFVATVSFDKTVMLDKHGHFSLANMDSVLGGQNSGYLLGWSPDKGLYRLPDSEAPFNNGIQFSRDGRQIYFNAWTADQLRVYDLAQHKTVKTVAFNFLPDNLSVGPNGWYIAAGITDINVWKKCAPTGTAFCSAAFRVAAWNPTTGQIVPLFDGTAGYMAGASVGLQVGHILYVGSFSGDRVLGITLPPQAP